MVVVNTVLGPDGWIPFRVCALQQSPVVVLVKAPFRLFFRCWDLHVRGAWEDDNPDCSVEVDVLSVELREREEGVAAFRSVVHIGELKI